jgi:hypothetical protein
VIGPLLIPVRKEALVRISPQAVLLAAFLLASCLVPAISEDRRPGERRVAPRPWISEVRILGNGRMSRRRLQRVIEPYEYSKISPYLLDDCKKDCLDLYRSWGFDRACVECELHLDEKGRWRLDVLIVEGI